MTAPLASWSPPSWATSSRLDDGGVDYERPAAQAVRTMPLAPEDGPGFEVTPVLIASDGLRVSEDGGVVAERGPVRLLVDDLELSPEQARALVGALVELLGILDGAA